MLKRYIMRNSILVFILLFPHMAGADINSCLATKYKSYSEVKSDYQKNLTKLIISKHPEFSSIANTYMSDQLIRIEKNLIAFTYLQKNSPHLLTTNKKINQWVGITNDEQKKIAANDHRYAEILKEIEVSKHRPPNSMGDDLRKVMRSEIIQLPEFSNITSELSSTTKRLNESPCQ